MRKQDRLSGGKLKKSLLKALFKNSPFDIEVLAQKYEEKNPKRDGKNWL